ncbi:MAG: winged helix-turn-helix domain-containing protein [Chloroflexi bacterium]|nr:winged helix-turn-helix domain-containing protein [Chloroflexota bacterium]
MESQFVKALRSELSAVSTKLSAVCTKIEVVRTEMAGRLTELENEKDTLEALLRHIQALLTLEGVPVEFALDGAGGKQEIPSGKPSTSLGASLADAVHLFLSQEGKEYHYIDLTKALVARGVIIPGKDPGNNLVAHIYKDPRFLRPKRGVYGLRQWYPTSVSNAGIRKVKRSKRTRTKSRARR